MKNQTLHQIWILLKLQSLIWAIKAKYISSADIWGIVNEAEGKKSEEYFSSSPFHTGSDKIQSNQRRLKRITGNKQNLVSKYWKVMKNTQKYMENTENTENHWKILRQNQSNQRWLKRITGNKQNLISPQTKQGW